MDLAQNKIRKDRDAEIINIINKAKNRIHHIRKIRDKKIIDAKEKASALLKGECKIKEKCKSPKRTIPLKQRLKKLNFKRRVLNQQKSINKRTFM